MKNLIKLLLALTILVTTGCEILNPPPRQRAIFKTSIEITASYDEIWSRIVTFLGNEPGNITIIDKNSGMISIEYPKIGDSYITMLYPDCYNCSLASQKGKININVKQVTYNSYQVAVNTFFTGTNNYTGYTVDCWSSGQFENKFFNAIKQGK